MHDTKAKSLSDPPPPPPFCMSVYIQLINTEQMHHTALSPRLQALQWRHTER